jgi:adenylosuccinate lyase
MIARYTRPEMGRLFTDQHKYETWLDVELAVCKVWADEKVVPLAAFNRIRKNARFKLDRIEAIEREVQHDVIAFTTAVAEHIGKDSAWFHRGLTSSDVVDTAQCLILKQAGRQLEEMLARVRAVLGERAIEHARTPAIGRTHGVHAEPTTFGLKLLVWYDELGRHEERLASAIDQISVGKLSGAVGNFAHIPPSFEERVLRELGLQPAPVSNQVVQRDRHAYFICVLAGLGATLEKIAVNLRAWQRTEIHETLEPFSKGQKGSSAMPHKQNPVILERITGLARVLRGYAVTALENVALWDERDISHSGAERVILPDACTALDYMLDKLGFVIANLQVREARLKQNLNFTKGLIFSQRVLLALTAAGLSREEAYAVVQRNALRCWDDGTPLLDALMNDRDVRGVLDAHELSALFTLEPYLRHVDELFARCGLALPAAPVAPGEPAPAKPAPRRGGRGRTAVRSTRSALGNIDSIATGDIAVQNISERASDYYESTALLAEGRRGTLDAPDETLGEAAHQKKRMRGGARAPLDRPRRSATAEAAAPAAKRIPKADEAPPATDEPAPAAPPARTRRRKPADAAAEPASAPPPEAGATPPDGLPPEPGDGAGGENGEGPKRRRRRGSRGGRGRKKPGAEGAGEPGLPAD